MTNCKRWNSENFLSEFQPLEFQFVGSDVGEIVLRLLDEPALGAAAKNFRKPDGHFGRYTALSVYQLGKRGPGDSKRGGCVGYA